MNINTKKNTIPLLDLHHAAFLNLHGLKPELTLSGSRVVFEFLPEKNFYQLSRDYNQNHSVPVLDFVKSIRQLKARMFSLKGMR
jgi:hypothetical protein